MSKFLIWVCLILVLHGCNNTDSVTSTKNSYVCVETPNLQLGEKATYKFNEDGNTSYLTSEVIEENNESYTIAFNYEAKDTEYYHWLKGCQSREILDELNKDSKKDYILTSSSSYVISSSSYILEDTSLNNDTSDKMDTLTNGVGASWEISSDVLDYFNVEAGTYVEVEKTLLITEHPDSQIVSQEIYTKYIEGYNDVNTPFRGILKHTIVYKDDSNFTIELIEWNGL